MCDVSGTVPAVAGVASTTNLGEQERWRAWSAATAHSLDGKSGRRRRAVSVASDLDGAVETTTTNDLTKSTGFASDATHRMNSRRTEEAETERRLGSG
jgi:hypothetical protein